MKRPHDDFPDTSRIATAKAILCDLDGCLICGDRVLPGIPAFIAQHRDRLWIVSNNSTDTPESLSLRLERLGIAVSAQRIILAGAETLRRLAHVKPAPAIALHAAPVMAAFAEGIGLRLTNDDPDTVVLCRDTGMTYASLARALRQLQAGARLVVANPDTHHPSAEGDAVPETGALLAAIHAVLPDHPFESLGKPAPALFDIALARAGLHASDAVMIGDNDATDGRGARALGIAFIQVDPAQGAAAIMEPVARATERTSC
ncbi:HAD-IIA family hydrolase [Saliniramus sp.]|uniref:HAD-IIA family hydrolase n=1 Tax=Saliniramus sp. TaxID=2986772 RepID=UPI002C3D95D0|nr:HAD family hydrolase [Saliniramus sp.]HMB09844.1 HAD family hydrolase [Saliniramus sp.]